MNTPKHTPGPWRICRNFVDDSYNWVVTGDDTDFIVADLLACDRELPDWSLRDARLIATAPDMLEALEYFVNTVPAQGDETIIRAKEKANAAIRKAKGEA